MSTSAGGATYHIVARLLHWLMAALIIFAMIIVIFREPLMEGIGWRSMGLHKSLGMLLFGLAVARLGWRIFNPPPPFDANLSPGTQMLAHGGHLLLYALMLALPALGYIISSAGPYPLDFFGLPVGKLAIDGKSWIAQWAGDAHVAGGYLMAALVSGHVLAALHHHFILKDRTLMRMSLRSPEM